MHTICTRDTVRGFSAGVGLTLLLALSIGAVALRHRGSIDARANAERDRPVTETFRGSWGELEALRIPVVNVGATVHAEQDQPPTDAWCFENVSEQTLRKFLTAADLAPWQRSVLLNKQYWTSLEDGWLITPPAPLIWGLEPGPRARIYNFLAKNQRNHAQNSPFRFPKNGFGPCLAAAGLPANSIAKLQRLTYADATSTCFADLKVAKESLPAPQYRRLIETLYQLPAYKLQVRVSPQSNLEQLAAYWGKGGREKLILPVLTSMSRVPSGGTINVSYMLPPFARLRLYTFPTAWDDPMVAREDCFYSSLNFFSTTPNTNFFVRETVEQTLRDQYVPVSDAPTFGDLLLLLDSSNQAVHCSVYIASDFVFTKNGVDPSQPWVVMKIGDMMEVYNQLSKPGATIFLRRKESIKPAARVAGTVWNGTPFIKG